MTTNWHKRFLRLAEHIAQWSKDPSKQIGAVAVDFESRRILSTGYNGLIRGIDDTDEILYNKELKYRYVVHAEKNCIYNATHNGISLNGSYLYVTGLPVCSECAKAVVQAGIKKVIMPESYESNDFHQPWKDSFMVTREIFDATGVKLLFT